jgi:hypothetical protein
MSSIPYQIVEIPPYSASSESAELFPDSIRDALRRIEEVAKDGSGPSQDNVEWAKRVLLRVLPRHYLSGAEIDAFQREIHVNWENGNKRVTVFLPAPNQIRIYWEENKGNNHVEHQLRAPANNPWEVSGVLKWLFA